MFKYFFHTFGSGTVLEPQTLSYDYLQDPEVSHREGVTFPKLYMDVPATH